MYNELYETIALGVNQVVPPAVRQMVSLYFLCEWNIDKFNLIQFFITSKPKST